jgi:nucleotide-binding universal stress UspA family protein
MLPFRNILFPVDYSEPCRAVVPYVREMVRHYSAELTLVHAYGPEALASSELALSNPELPEEVRMLVEQRLKDFAVEAFPGKHVETLVELGEAGAAIHKLVQRQGTDLVMLATHGRGPIRRLLLGSVAAKVLHDVSAAVWTGTGSVLAGQPGIPYTSVLCALAWGAGEEAEESEAVLKAAAAFAAGYKARLTVAHVIETPPPNVAVDFSPYRRELIESASFQLRELMGKLGIDAPHAVIEGEIPEAIADEAARTHASLIVTGRGLAQAKFSAMWSRLFPIVRLAPCPVLSI